MNARIHENGGGRAAALRTLMAAVLLIATALLAVLGLQSTSVFAAGKENVTDIQVPANETVLVSSKTGPVQQQVTDADYAKLQDQYKVTPTGSPTITQKTQDVQNVETKTDKGKKTRTMTKTVWYIGDKDTADNSKTQENPGTSIGDFLKNPLVVAPVTAAVVAPVAAIPAAVATAIPAAVVGGLVTAVPAGVVGGALAAIPAGIGGAVLNAIPAATVGALANAIPAGLLGGVLAAVPAGIAGATLNAIPAALVGGALNAIPAALVGSALTAIPAALIGAGLNALPAALAGATLATLPNLLKGFLDGFKLGDLVGTLKTIPAALIGAALAALPAALVGAALTVLPAAILAAIPAFIAGTLLGALAATAVVAPLAFLNGLVLGKLVAFPAGVIAGVIPTAIAGGLLLLGTLGLGALALPLVFLAGGVVPFLIGALAIASFPLVALVTLKLLKPIILPTFIPIVVGKLTYEAARNLLAFVFYQALGELLFPFIPALILSAIYQVVHDVIEFFLLNWLSPLSFFFDFVDLFNHVQQIFARAIIAKDLFGFGFASVVFSLLFPPTVVRDGLVSLAIINTFLISLLP